MRELSCIFPDALLPMPKPIPDKFDVAVLPRGDALWSKYQYYQPATNIARGGFENSTREGRGLVSRQQARMHLASASSSTLSHLIDALFLALSSGSLSLRALSLITEF